MVNSQNGLRVLHRKSDFFSDFADGCRCYSQKGSNVFKVDLLNDLGTATE